MGNSIDNTRDADSDPAKREENVLVGQSEGPSRFRRFLDLLAPFEPLGVLLAAGALILALVVFFLEHADRVSEREARAWQLVTTMAPGNSGKMAALEYLNPEDGILCFEALRERLTWIHRDKNRNTGCVALLKPRAELVGIDLSPRNEVGAYVASDEQSRVFLEEVDLFGANLTGANLYRANLIHADVIDADL